VPAPVDALELVLREPTPTVIPNEDEQVDGEWAFQPIVAASVTTIAAARRGEVDAQPLALPRLQPRSIHRDEQYTRRA
jgi:hypothetical protein